jgi:ketosteroid isomerase-like protein
MSACGPEADIRQVIEVYGAAFQAGDLDAVADHLQFPAYFVSDANQVVLTAVPDRDACRIACEPVVKWNAALGVASGRMLSFAVAELSPRLASVSLAFEFQDASGAALYDYQGVYTLVRTGDAWRIACITHNQIPRLLKRLSASAPRAS